MEAGTYMCAAENEGGRDTATYQVNVLAPPVIIQDKDTFRSAVEGDDVVLDCEVDGDPPPAIVWLQDGVSLQELFLPAITVHDVGRGKSELRIKSVSEFHAGSYTCIASSVAGSDEQTYVLRVVTPPRLEDPSAPTFVSVRASRPATLSCLIHASPDPQIFWFKNNMPLDEDDPNLHLGAGGRDLKLLQVTEVDAANYSCLAMNEAGSLSLNFTLEVHVPPRFTESVVGDVNAVAGEDVELFCPVHATPSPSVLWMRDSGIIQHSFTATDPRRLALQNVTKEDDGRYTCLATNEAGTIEQDFTLRVMVAPKLLDLDQPVVEKSVVLNRPVTITCFIVADPPPTITWLKDDHALSALHSGVSVDNHGRQVSITRARGADAGNYTCLATNAAGTTTLTTLLTVLTPPTWATGSELEEKVIGVAGESLDLFCDVTGTPTPTILWLKDGQIITPLLGSRNFTASDRLLHFNSLAQDDSGLYSCITSNAAGTAEYVFDVDVLAPPSLSYQPKTQHTVLVNRALSLDCPVEGNPEPEVKWFMDDQPVNPKGQFVRLTSQARQLHLLRVLSSSEGRVTCLATNAVGSLITNYTLDVLSPPVITPTPPTKKVRAREGDSVTLTCRIRGHPRPLVAWVGGQGMVLTEEEMARRGFDLQEDGESLVLKKVDGTHEGRYTCIASNTAGSAKETFSVQVLLTPVIQAPEQGTALGVVQGSSVTLSCIVDARPPATLSWQKNGQALDSSRDPFLHVTAGGESLSFLRVQPQHAANYTCVASSAAGQDSLTYDLNVNVPPVIIEDMVENVLGGGVGGDTMGIVGGEVDLECYTIGTPTPTLTWEKDDGGIELSDRITLLEDGQVLRLKSAVTEDSGRYTCTATSPSGSASRDFVVVIHSPPRIIPPRETNLEVVLHQPLALTCEAESSLTPAVSWSRHGRPVTPYADPNLQVRAGGRELHLRRVREGDGGAFTCIVMNSAGQDTLTYTLTVQVPPVIQRANVRRQVVGVAGQSTDLLCEASGNPPPTLAWTRGNTLITPEHPHYQVMNGGAKLQVRELTREDTGVITCTATNPAGKDTLSYTLQVYVPPSVDEDAAKEMTVKEGNSVVLECPVTAFPAPSILWSVGGTVVGHGGRRNVDLGSDGRSLRIVRAGSENAGVYTCTASNTAGVLDVEVALRVLVPPQIARESGRGQLSDGEEELVTVMEGGHVALQCILLKGTPTPTRHWVVGPEHAEPAHTVVGNGEQLVITRAEEEDSGQYKCIAENPAGSATKVYQLVVQAAPRINVTALPPYVIVLSPGDTGSEILPADGRPRHSHVSASATSSEAQTLVLTCPVTGNPPPRRLWYQGSQALVSSSRVLVGTGGRDLTLVGVGPRDAGTYVCVAVNPAGEAQLSTAVVVVARPELEGDAEVEVAVVEGQDVSFECKVKTNGRSSAAHANYNITWMKDGEELPLNEVPQTRSFERLVMGRRPLPSSDYYYEGEEDFSYAEDVSLLLQDYLEGVSAEATSTPAATPEPADANQEAPLDGWREWRGGRNGTARYHTFGGGTRLRVSRVTERDEGAYACVVTNLAGASTRTFNLDTLVPPDIDTIQEVKDHEAAVGEPVVFECDARGDPPPEVTWYRGSAPLEHHSRLQLLEENHVLIITSVQEGDGGEYTCLATNLAGLTEETFRLHVLVPPRIAGGEEQAVPVVSGRSVELECEAQGQPEPDLIWTFEGEPVTESEDLVLDGNTLIIDRVKLEQAGVYECAATNDVGQDARRFVVSVTEAPFITGGLDEETVTVVEGESAALHCVASGHPEPLLTWMKEGVGMRLDERVSVSWGGRSLLLQYVGDEDSGRYTCVASNLVGNHTKDFRVQVLRRPQLVDAPEEVVAVVGEIVNVVCAFDAYPRPKISWQFEGTPVEGEGSVLPSGVLQISPVRPEDAGNYTCFANNEAGSANHTLTLTVQTPPWVEVGQARMVVVSGESATLECKAGGVPTPSVTWLKGHQVVSRGVEFEPDESGSLYIPFVTPDLADTYVCTARSSAGSAHAHTELVVQESPVVFGSEDEVVAAVGQQVVLKCEVTGQPTPAVTWTRPNHANTPVTPGDPRVQLTDDSLTILPVAVEDMGLYQCTATNPAGQDSAFVTLTVHSPPSVTEPLSEVVNVVRGEPLNLGCTGAGYPPPRTTWIKEGRTLTENAALTLATNGDLVISNTKASDTGLYICLVTNAAGRLYREVAVVVQVPPRFSVLPRTQQVTRGDRFELDCEAVGTPVPTIRWLLNGTQVAGVGQSRGGRGVLVVEKAAKTDEGTYTCIAENAAGHRKAVAGVRVKVPPVIMYAPEEMTVLELNAVTLTCVAEGDPAPATTWTKEGHSVHSSDRVHLMDNGSLVIDSSQASDAGEYKCVVSNDAGAAEATAHLVVHTPPMLTRPPVSKVVEVGGTVVFDCEAEGSPLPEVQWSVSPGEMHARYIRLTNGSLQLIAAQIEDEGHVICQAYNELGEDLAKADLSVKVSGMWASWGPWTSCSVSCGPGQQTRRRLCNAPAPRHGGAPCPGDEAHTRPCRPQPCPLDGNWSPWDPWAECSVTCGSGVRLRTRYCSAPAPLYGGRPCDGNAVEEEPCSLRDCPVSGGWGEWTAWSDCSTTCGQGLRQRTRLCDSPPPAAGGAHCQGDGLEVTPCSNPPCLLDGNWGTWAAWSVCSVSCGGGVRRRERACDDPPPSNGGRYCPGSDTLEDYCNLDMCPVNGGWSSWSSWGSCTATCGGGQRRRFRTCDNPGPSQGGRACTGPDTDSEACNTVKCPVNGAWSSWSEWSPCSMTCGLGMRVRSRLCNNPYPGFGGAPCVGEERETSSCEGDTCEVLPTLAKGTVIGELNGEDLGIVSLVSNVSTLGMQRTVTTRVSPLIPKHATWLTPLLAVASPVYWTSAYEVNGAANGHSLTKGFFRREAHVAFATGETVDMTHVVRGVDANGALLVDVQLTGHVPYLPPGSLITLQPYNEDYVQTGGGSVFATSTRTFTLDGYHLPYAWNQTISYDAELGLQPYLVQTLHAAGLGSAYRTSQAELDVVVSASISPASNSGTCPSGFTLDSSGPYCRDNDECLASTSRCSHGCTNTVGSYSCDCNSGYTLGPDGYTCQDVDECSMAGVCGPLENCANTPGSYTCTYNCRPGLKRTASGTSCEDINECTETPGVCDQTCLNLIGGYRCDCRRGFRLVGQSRCVDIDECSQFRSPCTHGCENTVGSFRCSCPEGHMLLPNGRCKDINECATYQHDCLEEQECRNTEGSYICITHCPNGLTNADNGTCKDIDECAEQISGCHFTQTCSNTWGSYHCTCPRGFSSSGPGQPCLDVNECLATPPPCKYQCHNLRGTYECICGPGEQRLPDGKSCVGLQYLEEEGGRAALPTRRQRPRPAPGYPTSEFQERLLHSIYTRRSCREGFALEDDECRDVNECTLPERCQHRCENTIGSFMCLCPPGYRLNANRRTCDDINECREQDVQCGRDQLCFNLRGSYKCVSAPCPPEYQRDPATGSCILDCRWGKNNCPPGVTYAHILAFKTASLPAGIQAYQDLVRLMAYDQHGSLVPQTLFSIIENETGVAFRIRLEGGKGILSTLDPLAAGREYRMVVEAVSYDEVEHFIKYSTRFIIFLHISQYPY